MTIIVHKGVDLDAFGSALALAAALRSKVFLPEPQNKNVRLLREIGAEYETHDVVEPVVLCDTESLPAGRWEIMFDHHGSIFGSNSAAVTLWLRDCGYLDKIPEELKQLLVAGIFEDTGFLRYASSKPSDFQAMSILKASCKNPTRFETFVSPPLSEAHFESIHKVLERQREISILGKRILLSYIYESEIDGEISTVVQLLQSLQDADAYVLLVGRRNRILGICRSRETVGLWDLLERMKPAGHRYAFVFHQHGELEPFYDTLPTIIKNEFLGRISVAQVELSRAKVLPRLTVAEALEYCATHGLSVACFEEGGSAYYLGLHDLERLNRLGLGGEPVSAYWEPLPQFAENDELLTAYPMLKRQIPLLVKKEDGLYIATTEELVRQGIIEFFENRSEVLFVGERLYGEMGPILDVLGSAGIAVYLIGGALRDYLLEKSPDDVDFSFEGSIEKLVSALESLGLEVEMSTSTFSVKTHWKGTRLEFTHARRDYYVRPGVLGEALPASITEDLERRDFTINAVALQLTPAVSIIDPYKGLDDLRQRLIRLIKNWSLREDPSRALRAIKYKNKLHFTLERRLEDEMRLVSIEGKPPPRVIMELRGLLRSNQAFENLEDLIQFNLMRFFGTSFVFDQRLRALLESIQRMYTAGNDMSLKELSEYLIALLSLGFLDSRERERFLRMLGGASRTRRLAESLSSGELRS
ncbi:polya polymerase [Coprothermobacteraceae bacterium]|nr:polya polymerase [Coprothermobacteraceae bacterium]